MDVERARYALHVTNTGCIFEILISIYDMHVVCCIVYIVELLSSSC